ncbi:extended synaptotagmin-1-like isoform X3 [Megalobrama amblycephala]|uniref:extended synaptotagmin-1-like isoform X3 n=1 Tax=Megalobrama amblycephala TaxID=75352 RepID=UPI0020140069|nr:extended synaptotagmin-1-like isoform X3 [Megalobrama amblycephala]
MRFSSQKVKSQAMVKSEWLKTVIPKVNLQDMEKAEWLNEAIQQAWPTISQYVKKQLLNKTIAPYINITKINFDGQPVKLHGVKTHKGNEKGQILFYVDISYDGDVEINVAYLFGVKRIQLRGIIGVILGPLIDDVPIVGAVTMFFVERPKLTITWIRLARVLNMGIRYLDTEAMNNIESYLVWPKYQTFPQAADLLRSPTD